MTTGLDQADIDALTTLIGTDWRTADRGGFYVEYSMMRDRLAIAHRTVEGKPQGEEDVAGIAIWASVSDSVDAKITEQVKAGVFPVRLANEDWEIGDTVWLLDVIAGDRKAATAVLANFRQLSGQRAVKIHPLVARMIDPDVLEKLRMAADA